MKIQHREIGLSTLCLRKAVFIIKHKTELWRPCLLSQFNNGATITTACEHTSISLLWSKAEQGPPHGQDRLLGPEGILGHLQSVWPMRRQLAQAGGGAVSGAPQLGERVLQLAEHVEPTHTGGRILESRGRNQSCCWKLNGQTWRCTRIPAGRSHTRSWRRTAGPPALSAPASAPGRNSPRPASSPTAAAGRAARPRCTTAGLEGPRCYRQITQMQWELVHIY